MYHAQTNDCVGGRIVKLAYIVKKAKRIKEKLLELIFPPLCSACDEPTGNSDALCPDCLEKYAAEQRMKCRTCRLTAEECSCSIGNGVCGLICSTFYTHYYSDSDRVTEKLLFRLKRERDDKLCDFFAREASAKIMKYIKQTKTDTEECIVTYPPRSEKGILKYGFDHAKLVAAGISHYTGIPLAVTLIRDGGEEQKTLAGNDRLQNVRDSLRIYRKFDAHGLTVFLFDDIVTTGATLGTAVSLLKEAGASVVIPVSVARTENRT